MAMQPPLSPTHSSSSDTASSHSSIRHSRHNAYARDMSAILLQMPAFPPLQQGSRPARQHPAEPIQSLSILGTSLELFPRGLAHAAESINPSLAAAPTYPPPAHSPPLPLSAPPPSEDIASSSLSSMLQMQTYPYSLPYAEAPFYAAEPQHISPSFPPSVQHPQATIDPRATTSDAIYPLRGAHLTSSSSAMAQFRVPQSEGLSSSAHFPSGQHSYHSGAYLPPSHPPYTDPSHSASFRSTVRPTALSSPVYTHDALQQGVTTNGYPAMFPAHSSRALASSPEFPQSPTYDQRMPPPTHPASSKRERDLRVDVSVTRLPSRGGPFHSRGSSGSSLGHPSPQTAGTVPHFDDPTRAAPSTRAPGTTRPRTAKRRKLVQDISGDDEIDSEDDDLQSGEALKLHKACSNCRKQKAKCIKRDADERCRGCRTKGLTCIFEIRSVRKQPVQRAVLLEELRKKDAVIESLRQMLRPHMLAMHSGSEELSSVSPPQSSAIHEEPLRKQVLEWLNKAEQSRDSTVHLGLDLDAGNTNESDTEYGEVYQQQSPGARRLTRSQAKVEPKQEPHLSPARSNKRITHPMENHPVALLAKSSMRGSHGKGSIPGSTIDSLAPEVGVARQDYFMSGSSEESKLGLRRIGLDRGYGEEPKLLRKGLIVPEEVEMLFQIFYEKLNVSINLLDPVLHTPTTTFARCPLLFTVVCAVSARYYTQRPELYSIAMHFAMTSASTALIDSRKSVELCQAFLLLSIWSIPARKHEEDRTWLYLGLAIRMAMDLNLHLPSKLDTETLTEIQERELLNRSRTWMLCYNMDRSSAAQLGKPMTVRDNFTIQNCVSWYKSSKYGNNSPMDLHLVALTQLLGIMSQFLELIYSDTDAPSGLKEDLELNKIALEYDERMRAWEQEMAGVFTRESDRNDPRCVYRTKLLPFYVNYCRLVVLSFGFQYSLRHGLLVSCQDNLVERCLEAACAVIKCVVDDLAPTEYLGYSPDGYFVFPAFAAAFLLRLLRPRFRDLISEEQAQGVLSLIEHLVLALRNDAVAVDETHTPKVYARFVDNMLANHRANADTTEASLQGPDQPGISSSLESGMGLPSTSDLRAAVEPTGGFPSQLESGTASNVVPGMYIQGMSLDDSPSAGLEVAPHLQSDVYTVDSGDYSDSTAVLRTDSMMYGLEDLGMTFPLPLWGHADLWPEVTLTQNTSYYDTYSNEGPHGM